MYSMILHRKGGGGGRERERVRVRDLFEEPHTGNSVCSTEIKAFPALHLLHLPMQRRCRSLFRWFSESV